MGKTILTTERGCLLPLCCLQKVTATPNDQFSMDPLITRPYKVFPSLPSCENTCVIMSSYINLVCSSFNLWHWAWACPPVRLAAAVGPASPVLSLQAQWAAWQWTTLFSLSTSTESLGRRQHMFFKIPEAYGL